MKVLRKVNSKGYPVYLWLKRSEIRSKPFSSFFLGSVLTHAVRPEYKLKAFARYKLDPERKKK